MKSEMEANGARDGARRNVVGTTEGREEIVQRFLVRHIDNGQTETHFVFIAMKDVVMSDGGVEQIAGRDTRRIVVVIFRARRRNLDEL